MKRLIVSLFLSSILLHSTSQPVATLALPKTVPLLINIADDIWAWNGPDQPLKQLTHGGHNSNPILSPDGQKVAYGSLPQFAVDVAGLHETPIQLPANIWVLNLASNKAIRVADQPPGAAFDLEFPQTHPYVLRGSMVWSPDSQSLAWSEEQNPQTGVADPVQQLVVYTLTRKNARVVVPHLAPNLIQGVGDTSFADLDWGQSGIVLAGESSATDTHSASPTETVYLYKFDGTINFAIKLNSVDCPCGPAHWILSGASSGSKPSIVVDSTPNASLATILTIDPATQQTAQMPGRLEYYSAASPDGLYLFLSSKNKLPEWNIGTPDHQTIELDGLDSTPRIAMPVIAPDGQQIAYMIDQQLYVFRDGHSNLIPLKSGQFAQELASGLMARRIGQN